MRKERNNRLIRLGLALLLAAGLVLVISIFSSAFELPKWFPFTTEHSLDEWETKIFRGRVIYRIEKDHGDDVLHALSLSTASAIFYRVKDRFRVQDYPLLSWRWKVVRFPDQAKLRTRHGVGRDDYAARVYVIFPSFFIISSKVLEYVWDETAPKESISDSPYSGNIKLIVARSGRNEIGQWVLEERNILKDYRRAFRRDPYLRVGAVALMSDADSIGDVAEAYFDDLKIGYRR